MQQQQQAEERDPAAYSQEAGYVDLPLGSDRRVTSRVTGLKLRRSSWSAADQLSSPGMAGEHPMSGGKKDAAPSPSPPPSEAHYITTHEIQLCEAGEHEPDYPEFGLAPACGWGDPTGGGSSSAPSCPLLEYASFDSQGGSPSDECSYYLSTASEPNPTDSTELVSTSSESDTPPIPGSLEEPRAPLPAGHILLSIKSAGEAIKEPSELSAKANAAPGHAKHEPAMNHLLPSKQHHRMVAIPARLQADISSGASSAVSELDDADKEVRTLTSRAFRSLAYPYFEAINFSSSESTASLSDHNIGLNSWSTYLDWKGGAFLSQKAEKTTTTTSNFKKIAKDASSQEQLYLQANKSHTLVLSEKGAKTARTSKSIQAGSRVVTLTETLNFSSSSSNNVKGSSSISSSNSKPPELGPASACKDGVTDRLPREAAAQETSKPTTSTTSSLTEAMEGAQKSKFASSLLKNIISKKMQLEQEFRMERGQLTDTSQNAASSKELEADRGLQRQGSKISEAGSDLTLVSSEDIGDFSDIKAKDFAPAEGHPTKQVALCEREDPKRVSETMKSTFRSQHSAFRTWKEKEMEKMEKMEKKMEEKVAKARKIKIPLERDWRAEFGEISTVQSTKMSQLYVPGIQHTPKEKQAQKQAIKYSVSTYAHQTCLSRNENEFKTEKLHILEAAASRMTPMITPKPQEIKLNLGLSSDNKGGPFSIAKLLTPNLASSAATLSKAAEEMRSQVPSRAEVLEKMPQFMVRDIREAKPKAQGTIHQVRDVRKLLKSSYSHDTGENSDRGSVMSDQSPSDQKGRRFTPSKISPSMSPIVITCQAVKNLEEGAEPESGMDGEKDAVLVHRASGRLPVATIAPNKTGPRIPVVKIVSKASKWKQEQKQLEASAEPQSPQGRAALEKLTAAVKTMEQLYVFDRNEWKRKDEPQPLAGSHVLPLISGEKPFAGGRKTTPEVAKNAVSKVEEPRKAVAPVFFKAPEPLARRHSYPSLQKSPAKPPVVENKTPPRTFQVSKFSEARKQDQTGKNSPGRGTSNANVFSVSAAPAKSKQQSLVSAMNTRNTRMQPPTSLNIPHPVLAEPKKPESAPQPPSLARKASADFENYLTIPVKSAGEGKPPAGASARDPQTANRETTQGTTKEATPRQPSSVIREATATVRESTALATLPPFSTKSQTESPKSPGKAPEWRVKAKEGVQPTMASSSGSEPQTSGSVTPATIYHHPLPPVAMAMPNTQTPIFYSPPLSSATPAEMYPQTQRKMLVDLATGQYYLVDTPVQPVKRRLFDPETGQYVDVPVPPPPVTPVPLPMPQLALSPGAYGHAYMFYPGFMPTPQATVLPAGTLQSQVSNPGSEQAYEIAGLEGSQQGDMGLADTPYYLATGSSASSTSSGQAAANIRRGSLGCSDGKQVINILSPTGPRIVAPPSFDGTTMRFVVEHR